MSSAPRADEALLRLALASGSLGEFYLDLTNNTVRGGQRTAEVFGFEGSVPSDAAAFFARVHPDDIAQVRVDLDQALTTGSPRIDQEYRLLLPDGSVRWVHSRAEIQRDGSGLPHCVVGVVMDTTEQRRADEQARQSAKFLRGLLDSLFVFVGVLTPDGILIEANRPALARGGLTAEDVLGKPFWDCPWWSFDRAAQVRLQNAMARALTGEVVRYDTPIRLAGDARITIDFMLSPMRDSTGAITHLIPSGVDISHRLQLEAALTASVQQSRQRLTELEALYATAPVGLCLIDRDLRFQRINERLAEINGRSVADHVGRTVREVVPDLAQQAENLLTRILATGESVLNIEITGETPAQPGVRRTWMEHWTPVLDDGGEIAGVNVVAEEITERKRMERRLRESEETARALAERRQVLLHEVNHRVKNSLALVASLLRLQGSQAGPEIAAAFEAASQRVMAVAEVHRGFYTGGEGDQVDLAKLLEEMIGQVAPLRPEVEISLEVGATPQLTADQAVPIGLIVNELLTNALKHAFPPGGDGAVRVTVDSESGRMLVSVADTGQGLPPGWSLATGSGLGGRLLQGLAGQIGADLEVESAIGQGTIFRLRVPARA